MKAPVRSPEALERVVAELNPVKNPKYKVRDITGDGKDETFCNWFVRDALSMLGVEIPQMLANDLHAWFSSDSARADGWLKFNQPAAALRAAMGYPTVASSLGRSHGHVALLVPPRTAQGTFIAQAGLNNFNHAPLVMGFGSKKPDFFGCP